MNSQSKTARFSKKILAAIAIVIIVVASASAAAAYVLSQKSQTPSKLPSMSLTLIGANGQEKTLTQTDISSTPSYTGKGGYETSNGLVSETGTYTGVKVTAFLNLVGGITSDETLNVSASDGYSVILTHNQVANGQDFTTFSPTTGSETTATQPLVMVLAYSVNGTYLASGVGPLRLMVLGSEGLLIQGHYSVYMVTGLQVLPAVSTAPMQTPTG